MGFQVPLLFLKNAEYHDLYKIGFKIDYIIADRTLRKYRSDYKELFNKILSLTLVLAYYLCFTTFDHYCFGWYFS